MRLHTLDTIILFVPDIAAAAAWYAELFHAQVHYENPQYAFIQAPGCLLGFHPADPKNPGGVGGATVYWHVEDMQDSIDALTRLGATLYRGPITTSLGARAAMLRDPFGCTLGLTQAAQPAAAQLV